MGWHDKRFQRDERKVQSDCRHCARPMWFPPSKAGKYLACSSECSEALRSAKAGSRQRVCETCGTAFIPRPTQLAAGRGRYCSQKCNTAGQRALNAPDAKARSTESFRRAVLDGRYVPPSGPLHPGWKGGRLECRRRRQESGKTLAALRRYRAANKTKVREFTQRRKHRKLGRLPKGTVNRIGTLQRWRCAACRVDVRKNYHVDHIVALANGGKHEPLNIQLLCPTCNVRKWAKDPVTFMQEKGFLL